jgi:hypothetical protein
MWRCGVEIVGLIGGEHDAMAGIFILTICCAIAEDDMN